MTFDTRKNRHFDFLLSEEYDENQMGGKMSKCFGKVRYATWYLLKP